MRSGQFAEQPWELFRLTYFPALSDTEAADLLGDWCARHGIEPTLREGKTELAGKLYRVIQLMLTPK